MFRVKGPHVYSHVLPCESYSYHCFPLEITKPCKNHRHYEYCTHSFKEASALVTITSLVRLHRRREANGHRKDLSSVSDASTHCAFNTEEKKSPTILVLNRNAGQHWQLAGYNVQQCFVCLCMCACALPSHLFFEHARPHEGRVKQIS